MGYNLQELIQNSDSLQKEDKDLLLSEVNNLNPLDRLKLEKSLVTGSSSGVFQLLDKLKTNRNTGDGQNQEKDKKILSISILTQTSYLGGGIPKPVKSEVRQNLENLREFKNPNQLSLLEPKHVTFGINDSAEQIVKNFLDRVEKIFDKMPDVQTRRNYFMNFIQSSLFSSYMNTGLTALRHPEIEPAKVVLNTLHQINTNYLNNNQFQYASIICSQIRGLCAL